MKRSDDAPIRSGLPSAVLVNRHQLAAIFGVGPNRITEYVSAGMPVAHQGRGGAERSTYDAVECAAWLRRSRPGQAEATAERARRDRAQAEFTELRTAERKGILVPRDKAIAEGRTRVHTAKARLLAMPRQLVQRGLIPPESELAVRDVIHEALRDLAAGPKLAPRRKTA